MNTEPKTASEALQQISREKRAAELFTSGYTMIADSRNVNCYWVEKDEQSCYYVQLAGTVDGGPRCSCPDFQNRRRPCKHILGTQVELERWAAVIREYEADMASCELETTGVDEAEF